MAFIDLNKRIPEPEEEMEGAEAKQFFISHQKGYKKKGSSYTIVRQDIFERIKIDSGKVLDVGCGYGGLIQDIHKYNLNFSFVGIDLSKTMVQIGREFNKDVDARFIRGRADKVKLKKDSFDLIICKDTFHHFKNPIAVIKNMYRLLRKGGHIYILDLKRNSPEALVTQVFRNIAETNIVNAVQYFNSVRAAYKVNEIKELLKKAKIRGGKVKEIKVTDKYLKDLKIAPKMKKRVENFMNNRWVLIIKK